MLHQDSNEAYFLSPQCALIALPAFCTSLRELIKYLVSILTVFHLNKLFQSVDFIFCPKDYIFYIRMTAYKSYDTQKQNVYQCMFFSCSLLKSLICDKAAFISIYTTQPVISGYLFLFIIFYLFMVRLPCLIFHYLPALYHLKFIFFYYILIIILGKLLKKIALLS